MYQNLNNEVVVTTLLVSVNKWKLWSKKPRVLLLPMGSNAHLTSIWTSFYITICVPCTFSNQI